MNEFFNNHKGLIISAMYLVGALLFLGYAVFYLDRQVTIADLKLINNYLNEEKNKLTKQLDTVTKSKQEQHSSINSVPVFLSHINSLASKNGIIIRKLTPDSHEQFKFMIEILVDYYKFLNFAADLESLDVTILDLQVRPYSMGELDKDNKYKSLPQHVITFTLAPRNDAAPLSSQRLSELKEQVVRKDKRNPFQRFAFDNKLRVTSNNIDLTWIYRLTGIGKDQNGLYATIDHKDYYDGDMLDNKKIDKIQSDRIFLTEETANGKQPYIMKFRSTSEKNK